MDFKILPIKEIKTYDNIITDNIISNKFNEYFTNIGANLANLMLSVNGNINPLEVGSRYIGAAHSTDGAC